MEAVITFAALGLVIQIGKRVRNVQAKMLSKNEARNMGEQMNSFSRRIKKMVRIIKRLQDLVPGKLLKIIKRLIKYCRERRESGSNYYYNYETKFCARFWTWVALSMGQNQSAEIQTHIDHCEDWLDVARMTLPLYASKERRRSLSNYPQSLIEQEEQAEIQCRDYLQEYLNRVWASDRRSRNEKLKRNGIDLRELKRLAENILVFDDANTSSTSSANSLPQHQLNAQIMSQQHQSNVPRQAQIPSNLPQEDHTVERDEENQSPACSLYGVRSNPASEYTTLENRPPQITTNSSTPKNDSHHHHYYHDHQHHQLVEHQNSNRSSSSSTRRESSSLDRSRTQATDTIIAGPPPWPLIADNIHQERPPERYWRRLSRSPSRPRETCPPITNNSHQQPQPERLRIGLSRSPARLRPSSRITHSRHPPVSYRFNEQRHRRGSGTSSRASSASEDSGFVTGSPRLRRSRMVIGGHPNYPDIEGQESHRSMHWSRASSLGHDSAISMTGDHVESRGRRR